MKKKPSRLTDSWKNVFTFSAGEKRGIYVLVIIIFLLVGAIWIYRYYPPAFPKQDFSKFEKEVDDFLAAQAKQDSLKKIADAERKNYSTLSADSSQKNFEKEKPAITYFDFDPNNLSDEQWKQLGLNDGQIRVLNNYLTKGGKFRKKEDLQKMYVLKNDYARLEPYIKIKEQPADSIKHFEKKNFSAEAKPSFAKIDIGIADTIELRAIKGVGASRARGIFKYRQSLGGFYSVEQLREVWGLDSVYSQIVPQVFIKDTTNLRKININTATAEQLGAHPYIRKKLGELIIAYRREHGAFADIAALKRMPLVTEDLFRKLAPYLKTQ
jgi:DNA uptake protein ComE-like DNA-binding protein